MLSFVHRWRQFQTVCFAPPRFVAGELSQAPACLDLTPAGVERPLHNNKRGPAIMWCQLTCSITSSDCKRPTPWEQIRRAAPLSQAPAGFDLALAGVERPLHGSTFGPAIMWCRLACATTSLARKGPMAWEKIKDATPLSQAPMSWAVTNYDRDIDRNSS